ncbi:uncharacterized protein snsl [Chelonus insularis]|uniref:uncharacterized protein snsl n=1 Tax=Chelonus insularis TaxID=460826 RepID=UPI00158D04CF|nr:uncharacterized protein LOC118064866 [Chelonus insularis]
MRAWFCFLSILLSSYYVTGLIIPEELTSILSLVWANIPPIRKGTDSRVGVGFRLGEHADFQVMMELGPQKETDPIGTEESKRRRAIMLESAMRGDYGPWAKSVAQFNIAKMKQRQKINEEQVNKQIKAVDNQDKNNNDSNWLLKWSKDMPKTNSDEVPLGNTMIQRIRMSASDPK